MSLSSLTLRQQRADIVAAMAQIADSTKPSDNARWKQLDEQQERLLVEIQQIETRGLQEEMLTVRDPQRPGIEHSHRSAPKSASWVTRSTPQYAESFDAYLRSGVMSAEMRALAAGSSPLVPTGFSNELETKIKYYNGLYNICRLIQTETGNPLSWPVADDTSNTGEWLAEAAGVGTADPTFTTVTLGANKLSSKQVKYSVELEQDSAFPLTSFLSDELAQRMGTTLDTALWTGDGSTIPITGLLTALVAAGGRSVLALGANATDGVSTSLNSVGPDDLSNLIDKLDYAYQRPTNRFVFNQTTLNFLRKLKDKYGRPVFNVSLAVGVPDTILGYGYTVDNAFANIGAGNKSVAFGDFSKYVVRRALDFTLVRFDELYMANYQRAVQAFMRIDAKLLNAAAFSYLVHPLS